MNANPGPLRWVPASVEEAQAMVASAQGTRIVPAGGHTKWGLAGLGASIDAGGGGGAASVAHGLPTARVAIMETRLLRALVEYDPAEFTFTAMAGTPLADVEAVLGERGQFLPFDPPFVEAGATLGGCVAAGIAGPGRLRYGGVRDFILGLRFIDGRGRLVRAGGRVVKNAAGFDLPKLLCGSRGRLGLIVEATFKVFPRPQASATLIAGADRVGELTPLMRALLRSPLEPVALDLLGPGIWQPGSGPRLLVRLAGPEAILPARVERVTAVLNRPVEFLQGADETMLWRRLRDVAHDPASVVIRLALLPSQVEVVDEQLERLGALRHYSLGGQAAWVLFPAGAGDPGSWLEPFRRLLNDRGLRALVLQGLPPHLAERLAPPDTGPLAHRVRLALDPDGRYGPPGSGTSPREA